MLRQLQETLWVAEMPSKLLGVPLGARSTIVRLADGVLWVHSPVALTDELRAAIEALGPVRAIVAPSKMHFAYFAGWLQAFPEAAAWVPPDWNRAMPGTSLNILSATPAPLWQHMLDQHVLRGSRLTQEVEFFHAPSRTLILTDLAFNLPPFSSLPQRLPARLIGFGEGFTPSRTFRWTSDKTALRQSLETLLQWPFERIIVAHGAIIESGGLQALRAAFEWVLEA